MVAFEAALAGCFLHGPRAEKFMAYCSKCGSEVPAGAAFCPKCGEAQTGETQMAQTSPSTQTGLAENVAGLLCYVLGWVTGLIMFLVDRRPFVRFHAAQSMVVFGGLNILTIVIGMTYGVGLGLRGGFGVIGIGSVIYSLIDILAFVLWIVLMLKAYQGEKFKLPVVGDIASNIAGKQL